MKHFIIFFLILCLLAPIVYATNAPELPREYLPSVLPVSNGRVIPVRLLSQLQAAIDNAKPGDEIAVRPNAGIMRLTFKNTPNLPGWITLRSANAGLLPAFGERVSPSDVHNMVTIESPDTGAALDFQSTGNGVSKAHNWLVIGFNLIPSRKYPINFGLMTIGNDTQTSVDQAASDIWLDRCSMKGDPAKDIVRGIALNGARVSVTGCHISEIHGDGFDSQTICGWNGPGPFKITNNYLEAAGENFMLGGADPKIVNMVPSDIEFRGNTCSKPSSWNPLDPSFAGKHWSVKNNFELKNARRILIDGNEFAYCWVDGQSGFAVQITPRNQDGSAPWSVVEDVTFTNNNISHAAGGISMLGTDDEHSSLILSRIKVAGCLIDIGASLYGFNGRAIQLLDGVTDLDLCHNTIYPTHSFMLFDGVPAVRLSATDNIFGHGSSGLIGSGSSEGLPSLNMFAPGWVFDRNVIIGPSSLASRYPVGTMFTQP